MGRCMKVRVLASHPIEEADDFRIRPQGSPVRTEPLQLRIGEVRVERAVADRMDRLLYSPTAALGHRVMPFDPGAQGA